MSKYFINKLISVYAHSILINSSNGLLTEEGVVDTMNTLIREVEKGAEVKPLSDTQDNKWKSGDECALRGHTYTFECVASWDKEACILAGKSKGSESFTDAWISELSEVESSEDKAKRERDEAVYQMWLDIEGEESVFKSPCKSAKELISDLGMLYDAGYTKGE